MLAAMITGVDAVDPLAGLQVADRPEPVAPEGWSRVRVHAASINHHDVWSLRGVTGRRDAPLPRVLGSDAAGTDESGRRVVIHALVNDPDWTGDEVLDPGMSMLSDFHDGTFAEYVVVPSHNLIPLPDELSFEHAACLPTAWLTAHRILFRLVGPTSDTTILVQGAGGGLSTAAVILGHAAGARIWVTSRSEEKRARAVELGADQAFEPGVRLPERVDAVIDSVGAATWSHSMKAVRPGGTIVTAGVTSGNHPQIDLERVFMANLRILGTTMGSRHELEQLVRFCTERDIRPPIHEVLPLADARRGFETVLGGEAFGKVVLTP